MDNVQLHGKSFCAHCVRSQGASESLTVLPTLPHGLPKVLGLPHRSQASLGDASRQP